MKASICIATYDKAMLLGTVLESIFCQLPPFDFETIVVDDGSPTDATRRVCDRYPVRYHRVERPPGFRNPCTARNIAYRMARGTVVIAQSEVTHVTSDCIERLVTDLSPGRFMIANVFCLNKAGQVSGEYTGPGRLKPFFFLGALYRDDLYAVGGNDEDFSIAPAYEDDWFAECLIYGRRLKPVYSTTIVGHHLYHPVVNDLTIEWKTKELAERKHLAATRGEIPWCSAGGPWLVEDAEPTTEDCFTRIYTANAFCEGLAGGDTESRSGLGSTLAATRAIRKALPEVIEQLGAKTFFDLSCGDCNWMHHVNLGVDLYIGADIVKELIDTNIQQYGRLGRQYLHLDLLDSDLPRADLVLCRDCLVHLSLADAQKAIANICRCGSTYLLTTTFTDRHENTDIRTGDWTPRNLQLPPFSFPEPLSLINEDCREHYPHFTDKSLGLWRISDLAGEQSPRDGDTINSLVVCVDFDDFLEITLPLNKRHFDRTLVVTSPADIRTRDLAERYECECFITDAFYRHGATFNKGAAIEEGFDAIGRSGWICVWDADIVMPDAIDIPGKETDCLYVPVRRTLETSTRYHEGIEWSDLPSPTQPHEFDGYFQLFHGSAPLQRPWYGVDWKHAGGGDSDFELQFPAKNRKRPPFEVLHLGAEGVQGLDTRVGENWCGRVCPRLDTGEPPLDTERRIKEVRRMVAQRSSGKSTALAKEKIKLISGTPDTSDKMPKRISLFWAGRMSWMRYLTLLSFRLHNPDWQICLYAPQEPCVAKQWTTHEDDDHDYSGKDYRTELADLGITQHTCALPVKHLASAQASDLFQWQLLGGGGGFYADMDILWLKSLEPLRQSVETADAVFCLESGVLAIGFLAANRHCLLFRDVLATAESVQNAGYQHYGTTLLYQATSSTPGQGRAAVENFCRQYPDLEITSVPDKTVYPFDWRQIGSIFEESHPVPEESVGLHWFGGDPMSRKWNNLLTTANWSDYNNTFTRCLSSLPPRTP